MPHEYTRVYTYFFLCDILGEVVAEDFNSGLPVDKEVPLFYTVSNTVEHHGYLLGMVPFAIPAAHLLSVCMGI